MPRHSQGPQIRLRKYNNGRPAEWCIRDRINGERKTTSTGLGVGATEQERNRALTDYLIEQQKDPTPKGGSDPHKALVPNCIAYYVEDRLEKMVCEPDDRRGISRRNELRKMGERLVKFFGTYEVREINGGLQKAYTKQRGSKAMARRELVMMAAAINFYTEDAGGLNLFFKAIIPEESYKSRTRYLTRKEAAALIRAAWRKRQTDRGGFEGRFTGKHTARAILVALYTGSRCGAICNAALMPTIGRGYVDLERGTFVRKALDARSTNKNKNTEKPIDLPPRLLAHMRRWQRLNISRHSVIEWMGKPVKNTYRGFVAARIDAGLDNKVVQHTLRHTAVSWYLQAGESPAVVADYVGMTEQILRDTYKHIMPGAFKTIHTASQRFGRA